MSSEREIPRMQMFVLVYSQITESFWVNIKDFTETDEVFHYIDWGDTKKRVCGVEGYPVYGFSGTVYLDCETYTRLKHFLDLQLQISLDEVKEKLQKFLRDNPIPSRVLWTRKSLYEFGTPLEQDEWVIVSEYPKEFPRDGYNEVLKKSGSSWRLKTPKIERLLKLESLKELEKLRSEIGSETKE